MRLCESALAYCPTVRPGRLRIGAEPVPRGPRSRCPDAGLACPPVLLRPPSGVLTALSLGMSLAALSIPFSRAAVHDWHCLMLTRKYIPELDIKFGAVVVIIFALYCSGF